MVSELLRKFHQQNQVRNDAYWNNLQKVLEVLNVLIFHYGLPLDINQNIISKELFTHGYYERIFLPLQVHGTKILVKEP